MIRTRFQYNNIFACLCIFHKFVIWPDRVGLFQKRLTFMAKHFVSSDLWCTSKTRPNAPIPMVLCKTKSDTWDCFTQFRWSFNRFSKCVFEYCRYSWMSTTLSSVSVHPRVVKSVDDVVVDILMVLYVYNYLLCSHPNILSRTIVEIRNYYFVSNNSRCLLFK